MPDFAIWDRFQRSKNFGLLTSEQIQQFIQRFTYGPREGLNLEKLNHPSINLYSARLSGKARLIYTSITIQSKQIFLLLEYLPEHDYENLQHILPSLKLFLNSIQHTPTTLDDLNFIPNLHEAQPFLIEPERDIPLNLTSVQLPTLHTFSKRMIIFNDLQQKVFSLPTPLLLKGNPGSGKTCISLQKAIQFAHQDPERKILYVVPDSGLVLNIRDEIRSSETDSESLSQQITVLCPAQLFQGYDASKAPYRAALKDWLVLIKSKELSGLDPDLLILEFDIIAAVSNPYEYTQLGKRETLFPQLARQTILDLYQTFQTYAQDKGISQPAQLEAIEEMSFDLVVVDESQNMQLSLLDKLFRLAKNQNIIFCYDLKQRVAEDLAAHINYMAIFKMILHQRQYHFHEHTLIQNFRSTQNITDLASLALNAHHEILQTLGYHTKGTERSITSSASSPNLPICWIDNPTFLEQASAIVRSTRSINIAILTSPEYEQEAYEKFDTKLIFTSVNNIIGQEFSLLILYQFIDPKQYAPISKILRDKQRSSHITPDHSINHDLVERAMNKLFVAITRATAALWIVQKPFHSIQALLYKLGWREGEYNIPQCPLLEQSTIDEWIDMIHLQIKNNNIPIAADIYRIHVEKTSGLSWKAWYERFYPSSSPATLSDSKTLSFTHQPTLSKLVILWPQDFELSDFFKQQDIHHQQIAFEFFFKRTEVEMQSFLLQDNNLGYCLRSELFWLSLNYFPEYRDFFITFINQTDSLQKELLVPLMNQLIVIFNRTFNKKSKDNFTSLKKIEMKKSISPEDKINAVTLKTHQAQILEAKLCFDTKIDLPESITQKIIHLVKAVNIIKSIDQDTRHVLSTRLPGFCKPRGYFFTKKEIAETFSATKLKFVDLVTAPANLERIKLLAHYHYICTLIDILLPSRIQSNKYEKIKIFVGIEYGLITTFNANQLFNFLFKDYSKLLILASTKGEQTFPLLAFNVTEDLLGFKLEDFHLLSKYPHILYFDPFTLKIKSLSDLEELTLAYLKAQNIISIKEVIQEDFNILAQYAMRSIIEIIKGFAQHIGFDTTSQPELGKDVSKLKEKLNSDSMTDQTRERLKPYVKLLYGDMIEEYEPLYSLKKSTKEYIQQLSKSIKQPELIFEWIHPQHQEFTKVCLFAQENPKVAIITRTEHKDEAEQYYCTRLIFTQIPDDCEYDMIIFHRYLNTHSYNSILPRLKEHEEGQEITTLKNAEDLYELASFAKSLTQAKSYFIFEEDSQQSRFLKELIIQNRLSKKNLEAPSEKKVTRECWVKKTIQLLTYGEHVLAQTIYENDIAPFLPFDTDRLEDWINFHFAGLKFLRHPYPKNLSEKTQYPYSKEKINTFTSYFWQLKLPLYIELNDLLKLTPYLVQKEINKLFEFDIQESLLFLLQDDLLSLCCSSQYFWLKVPYLCIHDVFIFENFNESRFFKNYSASITAISEEKKVAEAEIIESIVKKQKFDMEFSGYSKSEMSMYNTMFTLQRTDYFSCLTDTLPWRQASASSRAWPLNFLQSKFDYLHNFRLIFENKLPQAFLITDLFDDAPSIEMVKIDEIIEQTFKLNDYYQPQLNTDDGDNIAAKRYNISQKMLKTIDSFVNVLLPNIASLIRSLVMAHFKILPPENYYCLLKAVYKCYCTRVTLTSSLDDTQHEIVLFNAPFWAEKMYYLENFSVLEILPSFCFIFDAENNFLAHPAGYSTFIKKDLSNHEIWLNHLNLNFNSLLDYECLHIVNMLILILKKLGYPHDCKKSDLSKIEPDNVLKTKKQDIIESITDIKKTAKRINEIAISNAAPDIRGIMADFQKYCGSVQERLTSYAPHLSVPETKKSPPKIKR